MTTKSDMPELLPCPFCGSEPEQYRGDATGSYIIECPKCPAIQYGKTDKEAKQCWNTRTDTVVDRDEIDEMELIIDRIVDWFGGHTPYAGQEYSPNILASADASKLKELIAKARRKLQEQSND